MAERYATKTGNWSDVSVWDGGSSLPGVGDDVYANGYTVTINGDYTCRCLHTDAGNTASAGGMFQTSGAVTITADSHGGTTRCLEVNADGVQVGDSTGGSGINAHGTYCQNGGIQNGDSTSGSVSGANGTFCRYGGIQNGNSTGGSVSGAYGTHCTIGGIQNGNSTGGSVSGAYGTYCIIGGIQNGDSTGGSVSGANGTSCVSGGIQNGDSTGGSVSGAHGTFCRNGGIHNGNSTGGSASGAHGTYCRDGGIQNGNSTGGSVSGAYGTYCQNGGIVLCPLATGTVNGAYGVATDASGTIAYILAESGDYPKSIGANTDTTLDNIPFGWAFVPASNKVKLGTSFNNGTQSGTYYPPNLDTDPGVEDSDAVLTTAHYGENNAIQGTGEGGGYTYGDEDASQVLTTADGAGTYQPVDPADVRAGTDVGVSPAVGTLAVPAAADVRYGEDVDDTTGTCYVPAAADVQFGVNVDATTGTFTSPAVGKVIDDTSWGAGGVEFTGTYHACLVGEVLDSVSFGASSAETGTYHAPDAAEVISTAVFGPASGTAGTYDVSNVSAGNIKDGVSIGGVEGTYDPMAAAVFPAEANVEIAETAYGPTGAEYAGALDLAAAEAAAASAQHAADAAFLETNKDEIIPNGTDILGEFGVTGTAVVGGGPLVGPSALVSC